MRSTPTPGQLISALVLLATATLVITLLFGLSPAGTAIAALVTVVLLVVAASQRTALGRAFGAPEEEVPRPTPWAVLRQAWWTPIAALHGCLTLLFGVVLGFSGDDLLGSVIGALVGIAGGALMLFGLAVLLARPGTGSAMVVIGSIPLGTVFWLVWPPPLMVVVWLGVLSSAVGRARRHARTA